MCSIEEAWAGQKFEGSQVVSQGDMRLAYMNIPNNLMDQNNQFSINSPKDPMSRYVSRGINSKFSREPRVPTNQKLVNDGSCIQISSQMPNDSKYMGIEPRPSYMQVYDKADGIYPYTVEKDGFNDLNQAFNVSDTVNSFMTKGDSTNNYLLHENNNDDKTVVARKFKESNDESNRENEMIVKKNNKQTQELNNTLLLILKKLDNLESKLHTGEKNKCDMTLYILIGMLLAFLIYSVLTSIRK
jgi:hypothetical protein